MITNLFLIAITLLVFYQPVGTRYNVAIIFASITLAFDCFCSSLPGELYYFCAAIADLGIVFCIYKLKTYDWLAESLQRLCLISVVLNLLGWIMYEMYLPPNLYNLSFIIFYGASVIVLTLGGSKRDNTRASSDPARFFLDHITCHSIHQNKQGAAEC